MLLLSLPVLLSLLRMILVRMLLNQYIQLLHGDLIITISLHLNLWQKGAEVNLSLFDNLDFANPFSFSINNVSSSIPLTAQTGTLYIFILTGLDATFDFSTLYFRFIGTDGLTEKAIYTPSAVPVPAAVFLFAPALLGFMGLRRKAKNIVA